MKGLKIKFCISALAVLVLSTGCANNGSLSQSTSKENVSDYGEILQDELVPITSIHDNFSEEADSLKTQAFDNISFADTYFTFTEAAEVNILKYKITDFDISANDAYDYMCKRLDELFPEMFIDEEKTSEIRFFDIIPETKEYPTFGEYKALEEKYYPYILTNHPTTGINNKSDKCNECYLDIINGVLWGYDNGDLAKQNGFEQNLNSFDVLKEYPVVYRTENLESHEVFHLLSGDISISDAVKSAEKQLSEFELSERELPFLLRVQNVNVLDIGNNCYALYFGIVPEYKGLKYNCILPDDTAWGFSTVDDNTNEREACGETILLEADNICRYRFLNPASMYDIIESNSATSIISLKSAAEITSKYLTAGISFKALSVSAVYKTFSEVDSFDVDYEVYEKREITAKPCWRFVLQPLTGNTDRLYYIFVDMLTGDVYRTVQKIESEISYD